MLMVAVQGAQAVAHTLAGAAAAIHEAAAADVDAAASAPAAKVPETMCALCIIALFMLSDQRVLTTGSAREAAFSSKREGMCVLSAELQCCAACICWRAACG